MEEWLDILTPTGELGGEQKPKGQVHQDGDWHAAVHIWIWDPAGFLLIQRRSPLKVNDPNLWDISVAGHVSAGESLLISAQRELAEEIGLQIESHELKLLFRAPNERFLNGGTYIDREWQSTYLLEQAVPLRHLSLQSEEVAEVRWITLADFAWIITYRDRRFVPHWDGYKRVLDLLRAQRTNTL